MADLTNDEKQQIGLDHGVVVKSISDRKISKLLSPGTVIVSMSKQDVKNVAHFKELLDKLEEDEPIVLLIRQGAGNRFIVIERS